MPTRSLVTALLLATLLCGGALAQVPTTSNTITVSLVPDPIGGRNLLLRVEATDVSDLYGLSFGLKFPKKRLRWKENSKVAGSFFSEDDSAETVIIDKQKPRGTLQVGASRLGELPGVSGSGVLIDIGFVNRSKPGPRELTLSDTAVFDSNAMPIPDVIWEVIRFQNNSDG